MQPTITDTTTFCVDDYAAVVRLMAQLSSHAHPFSEDDYRQLLSDTHSHLLLLRADGQVQGMLTLGVYSSPTGSKAWIEDVVVDSTCRGKGWGRLLVEQALVLARNLHIDKVMLTSRPSRVAANALYQSIGFQRKETNMYYISSESATVKE